MQMLEALIRKLLAQTVARNERPGCRAVKPPQPRVGHADRYRPARAQILRISSVIRRREGQAMPATVATSGDANRSFCRYVDGVGPKRLDLACDVKPGRNREADLRITGRWETQPALRR